MTNAQKEWKVRYLIQVCINCYDSLSNLEQMIEEMASTQSMVTKERFLEIYKQFYC